MNSGLMDKLVTIEKPTVVTNAYGNNGSTTYATLTKVWMRMIFNGGSESINSDQKQAKQSVTFSAHYREDLHAAMRLVYNGKYYNIRQISGFGQRNEQYLKIETEVSE